MDLSSPRPDEGSNSEAIVYAGAVGLPNLTVVAVDNRSSSYGWGPGGIEAHFAVSGWSAVRVSGRDHAALASAFRVTSAGAASGLGGGGDQVPGHGLGSRFVDRCMPGAVTQRDDAA